VTTNPKARALARLRRAFRRGADDEALLVASALFDHAWYAAAAGAAYTRRQAVAHYLAEGSAAGLTPHPLFDPLTVRRARPGRVGDREPLVAYLRERLFHAPTHPLLDTFSYVRAHPESLEHPEGPLAHYVTAGAAAGLAPNHWYVPDPAAEPRGLADWVARHRPEPRDAVVPTWDEAVRRPVAAGVTSVLVVVTGDGRHVPEAVHRLCEAGEGAVEVVVVDAGTDPVGEVCLAAVPRIDPEARVHRIPSGTGHSDAVAAGVADARGPVVVLLRPDAAVLPGWLGPLTAALADPGVLAAQPLLLDPSGTIRSAGLATPVGGGPRPLLADFPAEDARGLADADLTALSAGALAVRREDLVAVGGFAPGLSGDAATADLCRRLRDLRPGRLVVRPEARVVLRLGDEGPPAGAGPDGPADEANLLADCGFELRDGRAVPARAAVVEGPPSLRWAIKNAAPRLDTAALWGDTHFARQLADALERLGQRVAVDIRPAFHRETRVHDDVALVLRGRAPYQPLPGQVSLLWLISHPELLDRSEAASYDRVLAASVPWAARASREWGLRVDPLLQATDPAAFHPDLAEPDTGHRVLFVGSSRGELRPLVRDAVAAGLPLAVYGRHWEGLIPAGHVRGGYLPHEELGAAYRSAGVVLNDHWDDMRAEGFLSNRLFDAVAAGARVVTDDVAGLREVFGETVQVAGDAGDLARLAAGPDLDTTFGDDAARRAEAARIQRDHSFDARARTLLDLAVEVRGHLR
jgi:hypothetical protein